MSKYIYSFFILIFISSCSIEEDISSFGEATKIKNSNDNTPPTKVETLNENSNSTSSFSNITLESLDQSSVTLSGQKVAPKLTSTATIDGKNKLLEELKKNSYYNPSVSLVPLPPENKFKNIRELIPARNAVVQPEQNGVSDEKKKANIESKRKSQEIMEKIEISGGFQNFAANNIVENKIYFAYFSYYAYNNPEYFSQYWVPERIPFAYIYEYSPFFFLRIKDENLSIQSITSNAPHLVSHIYENGNTIGIWDNSNVPITLTLKNKTTDESSTLELIFNPLDLYDNDNYGIGFAPPDQLNSSDYTNTNNQVEGVSESDRVKTDGNYIYSICHNKFIIFDSQKAEQIAAINLNFNNFRVNFSSDNTFSTPPFEGSYNEYTYSVLNFLNGNIIVFSQSYGRTIISFVDISKKTEPKVTKQLTFNSLLFTNRIVDDKIVMVFNDYWHINYIEFFYRFAFTPLQKDFLTEKNQSKIDKLTISDFVQELTLIKTENEINEIINYNDSDNIYFYDNNENNLIYKMVVLDSTGIVRSSAGLLMNYYNDIYITAQSIFLYNSSWSEEPETSICYFDIQNFKLDLKGEINIRGTPINRFCFHETKNYLFMAYHDFYGNENGIHTISLVDEMKLTNTLSGMAPGEALKSVRFVNNKAYVVTFEVVDPLFIIDYENPNSPKVLGEVKVTGYSTYLHEIYSGILLGVGFEADENGWKIGDKVSTFNVKSNNSFEIDKSITIESDSNKIWFNANSNHLDFVWYPSRNLLALTYAGDKKGFLVYRLDSKGAILDVANVLISSNYYDSNYHEDKIIFIGDKLFYFSRENVTVYPIDSLSFSTNNKLLVE